jgi:hypothetical protein
MTNRIQKDTPRIYQALTNDGNEGHARRPEREKRFHGAAFGFRKRIWENR